ncbi:peroxidase 64 [Corchorus capsularis]|uniref:Peroxidase 64 n=1 Tax=Corchorus capsularis TaxID=210143 RepID=A0A1R3J1P5_COCAP|nr:peroxidase 64 [Corchorus capsularis]
MEAKQSIIASSASCSEDRPPSLSLHSPSPPALCRKELNDIITNVFKKAISNDKTVPAALLRMHFHDCFIRIGAFEMHPTWNVGVTKAPLSNISPTIAPPIPTKQMIEKAAKKSQGQVARIFLFMYLYDQVKIVAQTLLQPMAC